MKSDFKVNRSSCILFTKWASVVKYLRLGGSKLPPKHLTSYVNAPILIGSINNKHELCMNHSKKHDQLHNFKKNAP